MKNLFAHRYFIIKNNTLIVHILKIFKWIWIQKINIYLFKHLKNNYNLI